MKILKFGGSSVGSPDRIKNVINILLEARGTSKQFGVVFSAFHGVTNKLIEISTLAAEGKERYKEELKSLEERHIAAVNELIPAQQQSAVFATLKVWFNELEDVLQGVFLLWELSKRAQDFIMAFGERFAAYIICESIKSRGTPAHFLDTRDVIKTDEAFGSAKVDFAKTEHLVKKFFADHPGLVIITGFIASTSNDETTTLGRGGSDYTAAIIGAAMTADEIEIWTDVDGVMTADPRKVKRAFALPSMSYEEAMELTHFGAKVIYPPTVQPALEKKIPLRIRNTFNPTFPGTLISDRPEPHDLLVTGISSIDQISLLRVQGSGMVGVAGIAMRLFGSLARRSVSVILITQASSEHTICVAVTPKSAIIAKAGIEDEFGLEIKAGILDPVVIEDGLSIVSVVGENMKRTPGIAGKVFQALGRNGVNVAAIAQGSSELNISTVIRRDDETKALNALHDTLFLSELKTANIFLVGTGLIGKTLLKQMSEHAKRLSEEMLLELKLVGISNSRRMLIDHQGISFEHALVQLDKSSDEAATERFVQQMISSNLSNSIFIDCTADAAVGALYERVLDASIPVVTPNKKAQSASQADYDRLRKTARRRGVSWLYETSVGAGLPVISTLNDLRKSGDKIIEIQAVLSGTLSYIFNSLPGGKRFSAIVREAQQKGYTEPDPRDDLNGKDVARKILILARESGCRVEFDQVVIEDLLSEGCKRADSIDAFYTELQKQDETLEQRRVQAEKRGAKLCYIASLKDGRATISLEEIDSAHPFYALSGADNIIAFTTERYNERPLVVKGPGAGAEVTAAGVFADMIRTVAASA